MILTRFLFLSIFLIACSGVIAGCGNQSGSSEGTGERVSFVVHVSPVAQFSAQGGFSKAGVVESAEQVTVSAQIAGRVSAIDGRIGKRVAIGQPIINLIDTNGTITFAYQKAVVGLEGAQDAYNQQKLNLEKVLFDAQIGLERGRISSDTTKQDIIKQQQKLEKDLIDSDPYRTGSTLNLQLQKLELDLGKAEFDYQAKLAADNQTIQNFAHTVKLIETDLRNLFEDIISASDDLLGVSQAKLSNNDAIEPILGNKDFYAKQSAQEQLLKTMSNYSEFKKNLQEVTTGTMSTLLFLYNRGISDMNLLLSSINTLLIQTEPGGAFSELMYTTTKGQFDIYKTKASGLGSSITNQLNAITTFFATYQDTQASLAKSIDSLKQQIILSKKGISDTQFNTQLGAERQSLNLNLASQNQELTDKQNDYTSLFVTKNNELALDALKNTLDSASILYQEASTNKSKFFLTAPIPGVITDILVDRGQEVTPGVPLFTIVNTNLKQVIIDITAGEKELIVPGQEVDIKQGGVIGKGIIQSVSDVANRTFGYQVIVVITNGNFDIGSRADIVFAGTVGENIIVPLNTVRMVDNNRGVVQLRKQGTIQSQTIGLGAMAGEYVIVSEGLNIDDMLITSDISNYDPLTMEIKVK
ncbi:MAG TPA: efflux RND transporter periplasmic adaptor subunit [Candidatus Absconditabacterales bacterium]|nr:efflux RND transporter periplasmic adaptor subunit [Candidatus Absconditabacterales bacterium]